MNTQRILLAMAFGCFALVVGCSNDKDATRADSSGGGGSAGEAGSGEAGSGGSISGEDVVCTDYVATGSPALIDDLDHNTAALTPGRDGRVGGWYTFQDGTGTVDPAPPESCKFDGEFTPTDGKACMTGSGFSTWGAGLGVSVNVGSDCLSCKYDASVYHGVRFTISGVVTGSVRFSLATAECQLAKWGGTCTESSVCEDCYGFVNDVGEEPQTIEIPWSSLAQSGWGVELPLNLERVIGLQWLVLTPGSEAAAFEELCVDDVGFY